MREGRTKKTRKLLIALSLRVEARGLFLQTCRDPATQARTQGLGKQPLLPNEKDTRGSHKKPRELLIALSLRAEARGLFLQPLTPRGSEKRDEKGHQAYYDPGV